MYLMGFLNSARPPFSTTLSLRVRRSSSMSPHQCRRSSSGRRCTLERRAMAESQPSCTAAATSGTDPRSAVTAVRAPRRSPPTLMNVPTQTRLSSRSYQVSFGSRTLASRTISLVCADVYLKTRLKRLSIIQNLMSSKRRDKI